MVIYIVVTPSVIGVRDELCACFVVDRNYISLQILFIPEDIPNVLGIACRMVFEAYRSSGTIVKIEGEIIVGLLGNYS